jgi:hypothetical protein
VAADLTLHDDSASRISFSGNGGATPLSDPARFCAASAHAKAGRSLRRW